MTQGMTTADAIFGAAAGAILHGLTILITAQVAPDQAPPVTVHETLIPTREVVFMADCGLRTDCLGLPPPPAEVAP